jgi:hypothetical protein
MTLGRRLADQTGAGVNFDSTKQCVIQITGSKTHSGTTYWDWPNNITVLQDPHNFITNTGYTTGFGLRKTSDFYYNGMPEYTIKLSTIQGGWTSDDTYFNFTIEARALAVQSNNGTTTTNSTNVTPLSGSPKHTTEKLGPEDPTNLGDGVQDWLSSIYTTDIGDFRFWATNRNPGDPVGPADLAVLLYATGGTGGMTITADVILEITRSDI